MVERKWIKSTNEINWKKIKTQINKQTWPESWKEMEEKVGACHGITEKAVREQKNDFSGMDCLVGISACRGFFSRVSWDRQVCQGGDSAHTRLEAEIANKKLQENQRTSLSLLGYCHHAVTSHETKASATQWCAERRKLRNSSWGNARGDVGSIAIPRKVRSSSGNFLVLSFLQDSQQQPWKAANASLSSALRFFTFPLPTQFLWIVYKQEQCFPLQHSQRAM